MLTVKSDDVVGRVQTFEAIVKGKNVPKPSIPESFKVLVKELQSLSLDVKVLNKDNKEIDISTSLDEESDEIGIEPVAEEFKEIIGDDFSEIDFEEVEDEDDFITDDSDMLDGIYDPEEEEVEEDVLDY